MGWEDECKDGTSWILGSSLHDEMFMKVSKDDDGSWIFTCHDLGVSYFPLESKTIDDAKLEALDVANKQLILFIRRFRRATMSAGVAYLDKY